MDAGEPAGAPRPVRVLVNERTQTVVIAADVHWRARLMARHLTWVCVTLMLVAAPARTFALCHPADSASRQNPGAKRPDQDKERRQPPPKWWIDEPMRGELGITDQQSAA